MSTTPLTYRDAGVDIDAGNEVVERIKPLVKRTFRPEVMGGLGGFGALFDLSGKYREPVLVSGTDGVGTKLKLAQQLDRHDSIGMDLVAMCVNDVLVQGAEPLFFLDYFATGKLQVDTTVAVVGGIARGCELAGCALIGGETAEMPDMYPPGEYDLAGFTVGAVEKSKLLDGRAVRVGDVLLGIASSGPHSNGYSLVRRIYDRAGRPAELDVGGVRLIDALMAPTTIYVKPVLELFAKHAIHASAHITGGGLTENIIRVIPDGLGLDLEASAIVLPPVFDWLQREGAVPREEMWRTFNCGIGFVLVLAPDDVAAVSASLDAFGLAHRPIGAVVARDSGERVRFLGLSMSRGAGFPLVVLASGRGSNLRALLDAEQSGRLGGARVLAVASDRPGCAALELARKAGRRELALRPADFDSRADFDAALFDAVLALEPALLVCAGFMRILSPPAVLRAGGRMINIHPALLPRHPGLRTHERALAEGDAEHGATVHQVIADVDAGAAIAQVRVPVLPGDDAQALGARVLAREHPLLVATVRAFAEGQLTASPHGVAWRGIPLHAPLSLDDQDELTELR